MSTFGRKSLVWWDYEDHSREAALRFNHTPTITQLSILEKWYPIGSKCYAHRSWSGNKEFNYEVTGYEKRNTFYDNYVVKIKLALPIDRLNGKIETLNPVRLVISPDDMIKIKRESKLIRIL